MVTNPMQRKARNSFLLGMLVMLIIAAIIIGILMMQIIKTKEEELQEELANVNVYVLNTDVTSGQIITTDMLIMQEVPALAAPINAVTDLAKIIEYSLEEKKTGNPIKSDKSGLYVEENGTKVRIVAEGENYYKTVNNQKELVEFMDVPLIAKVDMQANSVVTLDLLAKSDEIASNDLRLQEYSMLVLPIKLNVDDYIDIRFTLPSGQDYLVVSKKRVVDVMENTIWVKLSEEEIITLNNAIYEAYTMPTAKLYANLYIEPGIQEAAQVTYPINSAVWELVNANPNIVTTAKRALSERLQSLSSQRNDMINAELNNYEEVADSNIEQKVKEENEQRQELREKYLEELAGATTGIVE